jgi:pimeloyl-ACP methyl ester carboxylesterase
MIIRDGYINLQGTDVHYLHAGEHGEPILLLHGGGTDSAALSWGHLITRFAATHRVIAPDWPGYGESDRPDLKYSIPYYISMLLEFTNALSLDKSALPEYRWGVPSVSALLLSIQIGSAN